MMLRRTAQVAIGSGILAFGLYQIHSLGIITEGGTLGLSLLLDHWFGISPSLSTPILNGACLLLGIKVLGKDFLIQSGSCCVFFFLFYRLFERMPILWPELINYPLLAAFLGGCFVGIGVGLCVRAGGAPSGDDALAMSVEEMFGIPIARTYLISDSAILLLSLSYIPPEKIFYSFITVILSGQIIGWMQKSATQ